MKRLLFMLLGTLCLSTVIAQTKQFKVTGVIKGLPEGAEVKLQKPTSQGLQIRAIAKVKKGSFLLTGDLPLEGELLYMLIDTNYSKLGAPVWLSYKPISLTGDLNRWPGSVVIKGSEITDTHLTLMSVIQPIHKDIFQQQNNNVNVLMKIDSIKRGTLSGDTVLLREQAKNYQQKAKGLTESYFKKWKEFIASHPQSLYTPFTTLKLADHLKADGMEQIYNKLNRRVQDSFYGVELKNAVVNQKRKDAIKVDAIAPNFISLTSEGKTLSLMDVASKSKLTLVDFWGSWCKPCREAIPALKKVYETFHDKGFNILGVAFEYSRAAWLKALKEENTPWPQVSQIKGRDEAASKLFDVNGVPAYILIDTESRIVALDLPGSTIQSAEGSLESNKLYKILEEKLGKQ